VKQAPQQRASARGMRLCVLRAEFNATVVDGLVSGALAALRELGASARAARVVSVPGAFELPLAARAAAKTRRFDAVVALGAVIRGDTDHYEHVAREAAAGLAAAARETGVPVAFGVLTCASEALALARSAPGPANKGAEAARAAVAMVHALRSLNDATEAQRTQRTHRTKGRKVRRTARWAPPRSVRRGR
jgi:6,7-dimethyl-8-ribityllumazine synthase